MVVNYFGPFMLINNLKSLMSNPCKRTVVVNVSSMEGKFNIHYKNAKHPHTNAANSPKYDGSYQR